MVEFYGLTFIGISIFFGFFALMCIRRFFALLTNKKRKAKIWIIFYTSIFFSLIVRAGSLIYTGFTIDEQKNYLYDISDLYNYAELFNALPYMVYLLSFFLIIWHYLIYYIRAHINLANDRNLFTDDVPNLTKKTIIMMFIVFPLFFVVFIIVSILAIFKVIDEWILIKIVSYFNISSPCISLGYYIFLNVKFSGRPYRDEYCQKNVKTIIKICTIWSLTRIISGIIYLACEITDLSSFISNDAPKSDSQYKTINILLIFVFFILLEILPIYFSLEHSFAKTFIRDEQINLNENREKLIQSESDTNSRTSIDIRMSSFPDNAENISNSNSEIKVEVNIQKNIKDYLINENEIEMGELMFGKKNGLGELYRGIYQNENVICRVIKFDRLSRYNIENIISDFEKVINLSDSNIDIFIGYSISKDNKVIIVNKEYQNGSLYDYVQINKNILSNDEKMKIALGIINGINYLHKHKILHCHLSSKNILLEKELNPKLTDFGFTNLYDLANLFIKYKNKNSYSPPEILKSSEFYKVPDKIDENLKKIDIYSFGMILWELITGTVPFDVKLSEIKKYILEEKVRPEVPQNIDPNLIALIRNCWDSEIDKRPTEEEIIQFLNENNNIFANS